MYAFLCALHIYSVVTGSMLTALCCIVSQQEMSQVQMMQKMYFIFYTYEFFNHYSSVRRAGRYYLSHSTQVKECQIKTKRVKGHRARERLIVAFNVSGICEMYYNFWLSVAMVTQAGGVEDTEGTWEQTVSS